MGPTTIYLTLMSEPDGDRHRVWEEKCAICGLDHPSLWAIQRKLKDTFGHFPVFRINGEEHVPDMSLPTPIDRIPKDAIKLTPAQCARLWHNDSNSHTFSDETYHRLMREQEEAT